MLFVFLFFITSSFAHDDYAAKAPAQRRPTAPDAAPIVRESPVEKNNRLLVTWQKLWNKNPADEKTKEEAFLGKWTAQCLFQHARAEEREVVEGDFEQWTSGAEEYVIGEGKKVVDFTDDGKLIRKTKTAVTIAAQGANRQQTPFSRLFVDGDEFEYRKDEKAWGFRKKSEDSLTVFQTRVATDRAGKPVLLIHCAAANSYGAHPEKTRFVCIANH